jgi:hypothetical protein
MCMRQVSKQESFWLGQHIVIVLLLLLMCQSPSRLGNKSTTPPFKRPQFFLLLQKLLQTSKIRILKVKLIALLVHTSNFFSCQFILPKGKNIRSQSNVTLFQHFLDPLPCGILFQSQIFRPTSILSSLK